jgi:hypothetical protein
MTNNVLGHLTAVNFLTSVLVLLSSSLQAAINNNSFSLEPTDLYVKKQIAGASGIYEILDANSKKLDGICSFDSDGRMETNRAAVFNRLTVRYGTGNETASPGSIDYVDAIPAALANAELEIIQDGDQVLRKSVRSLFAGDGDKDSFDKAGNDHAELASIRLLRDDKDIKINLRFPAGVTMPAAGAGTTPFIYVSLDALVTKKK